MNGLILSDNLEMTNIVKLTDDRIRRFTMSDLRVIFESVTETEAKLLVSAIKDHKFEKVGHIFEMVTYREMQKDALPNMLREQAE